MALHPEHFLQHSSVLTVYDLSTSFHKHYVTATDQCLHESPNPSSPCLPPFHHVSEGCSPVNVFLVIINGEIKFCHYFEMVQPTLALPADVIYLMHHTMYLVELLTGSRCRRRITGATVVAKRLAGRQKNPPRTARSGPETAIKREEDVDLETRMAYERCNVYHRCCLT